jgi:hypothetical protein
MSNGEDTGKGRNLKLVGKFPEWDGLNGSQYRLVFEGGSSIPVDRHIFLTAQVGRQEFYLWQGEEQQYRGPWLNAFEAERLPD